MGGAACPTDRPTSKGRPILTNSGSWSCVASLTLTSTSESKCPRRICNGRRSLPPLSVLPLPLRCLCRHVRRRCVDETLAAFDFTVLSPCVAMCWRLLMSLCCRRMWRCAGEMLAVLACCHCAVAGVRRCAGDVMAITAVWRCTGGEVGLAVLLLLASMLLPSHSWRAMVSSSSRSMNMSTIV